MNGRNFLINLVINMLSIVATAWLLPGITIPGTFGNLLIVALVFGLVNAIVRPIVTILSLPFIVVTLGLFIFVLNGLLLWLVAAITPLTINGFWWAVLGAIVMGFVNMILSGIVRDEPRQQAKSS